jgi:hypothetical protein
MADPRPFIYELHRRGFIKTDEFGPKNDMTRIYGKQISEHRLVEVELWRDGRHRAIHSWDGCSDTVPTEFETMEEMIRAIEKESTRTDSKWAAMCDACGHSKAYPSNT